MKIDLTCPVELWRYEKPKADYHACDLMMFDLEDKIVSSVELTLVLFSKENEEVARLIYRAHDLNGQPGKTFGVSVPVDEGTDFHHAEVIIDKVWFDDSSIWRKGKAPMTEYTPNNLPNSRSLEKLRQAAGNAAVGYPEEQEGLWMCICGRPNADYSEHCIRCHREKKQVFSDFTKENIDKLAGQREQQLNLKAKAAREDASRLQLQREAAYVEKKKKRRKAAIAIAAVLTCALLIYVGVYHVWPYVTYRSAITEMENGSWQKAEAVFADMGDYLEAESYEKQCRYLGAKNTIQSDDEAAVFSARETLIALGDYEDAPALAMQADHRRAGLLMKAGRLEEASELYASLGDYEDSAAKVAECAYLMADELLSAGKYEEARAAFTALGDYEDSAIKAKQAVYLPGKAALEAGKLDEALALLEQVPEHEDAQALIQQVKYLQAANLRDQGDLAAAAETFLEAGSYADASDQAKTCFYTLAEAAMAESDYVAAADLYAKADGHQDAADKHMACLYALAVDRMNDMEFSLAREYLFYLPDDYQDVASLRQESWYQPAQRAFDKKDYATAAELFVQVPGYKDADKQLNKARYRLAESYMDEKDYMAAISLYEQLGDYSDSEKQLRIARYNQANILLENKDYSGAETLYNMVSGYKNTEDRLNEIHYMQATDLLAGGDHASARPLFEALGNYQDAKTQLKACDYLAAKALMDGGKLEEAALAFGAIGDYQDAAEQSAVCWYTLAKAAQTEGRALEAAALYEKAGDHQDASVQATAIYDAHYQGVADQARESMDQGEYALTVRLLEQLDLTALPEKYAFLRDIYEEANFQEAEKLFSAGYPYEAAAYYHAIPQRQGVEARLNSTCYRIIGTWQDDQGAAYAFSTDGQCTLAGRSLLFAIDGETLKTGTAEDGLLITHRIASIQDDTAVIYDLQSEQTLQIRLTRVTQTEQAPADHEGVAVVDE